MTTQTEPLLITAREAGRLLACSPQTVKRLAERGDLRLIRFGPGGHVRLRRRDVEEFIEAKEDRPCPA